MSLKWLKRVQGWVVVGCGSSSQSIVLVEGVLLIMVKTPLYQDHTRYGWKKEVRGCGSLCCGPIIIGGKKDGKSPNSPHLMYQECKQGLSTEGALMLSPLDVIFTL